MISSGKRSDGFNGRQSRPYNVTDALKGENECTKVPVGNFVECRLSSRE